MTRRGQHLDIPTEAASITIKPRPDGWRKRPKIKTNQTTNRSGSHRGFWYICKGGGYKVEHTLWWMFPALPKSFHWTRDMAALRQYVDAWYLGDRKTTARYERENSATDIVMPTADEVHAFMRIRVNLNRLVDTLTLTDAFDVPLWGHSAFVTDGNYLVPCDYINRLVSLDPKRFGHLDPTHKWERAMPQHLKAMGLKPEQVTSGMYLRNKPTPDAAPATASDGEQEGAVAATSATPRERTLLRRDRVDYIEWVTEIIPDDQPPYFCRRLYRDQQMLYEATSYNRSGPWTVYSRDNNALLALGVDP